MHPYRRFVVSDLSNAELEEIYKERLRAEQVLEKSKARESRYVDEYCRLEIRNISAECSEDLKAAARDFRDVFVFSTGILKRYMRCAHLLYRRAQLWLSL